MARYIDADVLKDDVIKLRRKLDITRCSNDYAVGWITGVDNMEGVIDRQSKADVAEVKHGKWIAYGLMNPQCSICHKYNIEKSRFCPNCGAKMDGGKEE